MLTTTLTLLLASTTLAFGAVYPWGYVPLFVIAAAMGLLGLLTRRGSWPTPTPLAIAWMVLVCAIAAQVLPLPRPALDFLSPNASGFLNQSRLGFAGGHDWHPVSVNPGGTLIALTAIASLALYLTGLPRLLARRDMRSLPRNLMLFGVLLAIGGIYGREHNNGLVYGFWQPREGTNANGFGPFVNRNHFAGWMLMATCLTLGALCGRIELLRGSARRDFRDRLVWLSTPDANRIALIGAAALTMAISLIWTMSRSGIVAFVCALICFLWLVGRRRRLARSHRVAIVVILAVVLGLGLNWRGIDRIVMWFGDTTDLVDRMAAWRDGWQVLHDFPITGTGMNSYAYVMLLYQKHVVQFWMTRAHNDYLQLLAEGGLLVSLPAIVVIGLLAATIRRRIRQAEADAYEYWVRVGAAIGLLAIAIQEIVEFSLQIPANALLFATLAAIAAAPARRPADARRRSDEPGLHARVA